MMGMPFHSLAGVPDGNGRLKAVGVSVGGSGVFVDVTVALGSGVLVGIGVAVVVGVGVAAGIRAEQAVIPREPMIINERILDIQSS